MVEVIARRHHPPAGGGEIERRRHGDAGAHRVIYMDGRKLPGRIEVRHSDKRYAILSPARWTLNK